MTLRSVLTLPSVLDYVGVATFAMVSTVGARDRRLDLVSSALLGTVAGIGGGILRDVLAGERAVLVRRDVYVTVALLSAALFVTATRLDAPPIPAAIGAAAAGTLMRVLVITRRWQLPAPPGS